MKELVRFLVAALVDHPEDIELYEVEGSRTPILELKVHPDDLGKVRHYFDHVVRGRRGGQWKRWYAARKLLG